MQQEKKLNIFMSVIENIYSKLKAEQEQEEWEKFHNEISNKESK